MKIGVIFSENEKRGIFLKMHARDRGYFEKLGTSSAPP
jgi:hypothetical protein